VRAKIVVATLALIAGPAMAADLPVKAPLVAAPQAYNWTGFYIGANVGYGWGGSTGGGYSSFVDSGIGGIANFMASGGNVLPSLRPSGVIGGAQIGYNWQASPGLVFGVVADFQGAGLKKSGANTVSIGSFQDITESKSVKTDWFGTVRAKAGFAQNNVLYYGTGGLAYGHVRLDTSFDDPSFGPGAVRFAGSSSATNVGWALGGGVEWAIAPTWTVGGEYLYMDLGKLTVTDIYASGNTDPRNTTFTSESRFRDHIARLVINHRF
jgi:outer membrane immunogenic protein